MRMVEIMLFGTKAVDFDILIIVIRKKNRQ